MMPSPRPAPFVLRHTDADRVGNGVAGGGGFEQPSAYLGKLSATSLSKYQKHYRLRGKSEAGELLKTVVRHFEAQSVEEAEAVQNFLFALQKAGL
jgi:hypothetical protein